MSFSGDVKRELCRIPLGKKCCAVAEAYGMLLHCNSFSPSEIKMVTESQALARRLPTLFQRAFRIDFDQLPPPGEEGGKQIFAITRPDKLAAVLTTFDWDTAHSPALHLNFAVVEEEHCRAAFLRGAFLAGGSVTDPGKGYHLELVCSHYSASRECFALLQDMGFSPKHVTRKANYITYFKQSEYVEDLLTVMGAPLSAMELMTAKVEKHLRNGINRRVNCDTANLGKMVDAAQEQLAAIRVLERRGELGRMSDKLREAAALRLEYPELSLAQLAELCDPPITKSSLNHRLQKLIIYAGHSD